MIDSMEFKRRLSTAKPLVKGYNFFKSNHVLCLYYLHKDSKHYIKSQVLPSMKKKMVYTCYIKLSSFGFVLSAKCGCPAGVDGRCNHVCATLFFLDSVCKKNKKSSSEISCTSKPCEWSVPRKRKEEVQPISAMKFQKYDYNKENKKAEDKCKYQDVSSINQEGLNSKKLQSIFNKFKELENEVGKSIGWCHILPQDIPVEKYENELISPIKVQDSPMAMSAIKERMEKIKKCLFIDYRKATEIEKETREQSFNKKWHLHRQYRITASKCYRAAVLKQTTSPTKAINEILYAKFSATKQMIKGLEMEPEIMKQYIKEQHKRGHDNLSVSQSGLIVGKHDDGFLGASPDGLVCDPSNNNEPLGILEMKFIETSEKESLTEAVLRKHMCVKHKLDNSGITINRNHKYFYQIQQGMYLSGRKWADFVIAGSCSPGIYIERVPFDSNFWCNTKAKLKIFYEEFIIPELAYPKIKYGLPRNNFTGDN